VQKLLDGAEHFGADTRAIILTAVRTGVRMGELFGLQWGDCDFNSRFLEIRRNITRGRIETPKSGQLRRVDMSKQLSEALQELRRRRKLLYFNVRSEAEKLRNTGTDEAEIPSIVGRQFTHSVQFVRSVLQDDGEIPAWVFIGEEGQPHEQNNFRNRVFAGVLTKAGIRQVRFHSLRHTFASLLLQQGESVTYVKEQMGHHSIQVTVDIYGHLIPGGNKQAVDQLDDVPALVAATA
jgi:integrase